MTRAWVLLPLALVLAAVALVDGWRAEVVARAAAPAAAARDDGLRHCREAGESAAADPTCRTVWRAARARFLGGRP